ncbi:MAG: orotate phosphoribosyltransferase, partial [Parafilimonas sp.]
MKNERIIAEKLLQIGAVKLSPEQPFTWTSGWKSPIYCDNRRVLSFPFIRDYIKSEMCNVIFEMFAEAEMLAGVATAGIAWGAMAADQLKLPFIYVRSSSKEHGLSNQIEGYFETDIKTVIVEDLISTGKSCLQTAEVLRAAGTKVIGCVSIFNYGFSIADKAFAEAKIPYESLTTYSSLVAVALENGMIDAALEKILLQWNENPETWGR